VYDYFYGQWSPFSNHEGADGVVWRNLYVYLRSSGEVVKEVEGYFKDIGSSYTMRVVTGWFSLAGIQGWQRIYRAAFTGEYKSPHLLRIKVGYDFSQSYRLNKIFNADESLDIKKYGEDATYGESEVYGGTNSSYRFILKLKQQKCTAIRFLIEDIVTSSTEGTQESYTMTALTMLAGVKGGLNKLKARQNIGD
jgi:hypothetical protein